MKIYKNKKLLGALVSFAIILILFITQPWPQPSQAMIALRQVEQQLSLPVASSRYEEDVGEYKDNKGARHNTRYILLHYDKESTMESIVQKLSTTQDWEKVGEDDTGYQYINVLQQACLSLHIDPRPTDAYPHNIFIKPFGTDGCGKRAAQS